MTNPIKTAIITGACSGIGLATTRHLLAKTDTIWHIVLADIRPQAYASIKDSLDSTRTFFVETDVSKWEDNARLFKTAYSWPYSETTSTSRKIDFFFANAGTGDKEGVAQEFDLDAEPTKPDLSCLDVQVVGVFYGLKLFIHYSRKARRQNRPGEDFRADMVITSSCTALYPFPVAPQYAAGKAALLSLTRSIGQNLMSSDGITINCLMPGYVATNITPPGLNDAWPKEWITPLDTILRALDELMDGGGKVVQDGKSDGIDGAVKTGQSVECVVQKLYYRKPVEYADESQEFLIEESIKPDGLWSTYIQRAIRETGGIGVSR